MEHVNIYLEYRNARIEKCDNIKGLRITDLYNDFEDWYKKPYDKTKLKEFFECSFGKYNINGGWHNIKFIKPVNHTFVCEICSYSTNLCTNLIRHCNSTKHLCNEHDIAYEKQKPNELLKKYITEIKDLKDQLFEKDKRNIKLRDEIASIRKSKEYFEKESDRLNKIVVDLQNESKCTNQILHFDV
jgi:hypothetical protein